MTEAEEVACRGCARMIPFNAEGTSIETVFRDPETGEAIHGHEFRVRCPECGAVTVVVIEQEDAA